MGRQFFKCKGKLLFHWHFGGICFTHNYIIMILHKHNYVVRLRLDSVDIEDSGCLGCYTEWQGLPSPSRRRQYVSEMLGISNPISITTWKARIFVVTC
jgi:hypothetical protein